MISNVIKFWKVDSLVCSTNAYRVPATCQAPFLAPEATKKILAKMTKSMPLWSFHSSEERQIIT